MVEFDPSVGVVGCALDLHLVRVSVLEFSQSVDDTFAIFGTDAEWNVVMVDGRVADEVEGRLDQVDVVLVKYQESDEVLVSLDPTW